MREIKFRAWSKKENQFVDDFIIDNLGNHYQTSKCEFWGDDRDLIIMQSTNILDRNGKEIYEGDILKLSHGNPYIVKWFLEDSMFGIEEIKGIAIGMIVPDKQIIGNICENPDLLK